MFFNRRRLIYFDRNSQSWFNLIDQAHTETLTDPPDGLCTGYSLPLLPLTPFLYRMLRRIKSCGNHISLRTPQSIHFELRVAGSMPRGYGRLGRQRDLYLGRLRAVLGVQYGVAQRRGPSTRSARVQGCRAEDSSKNAANRSGAEQGIFYVDFGVSIAHSRRKWRCRIDSRR